MKNHKKYFLLTVLLIVMSLLFTGCMYFMPVENTIYEPELLPSEKLILPTINVIKGDLLIVYDKEAIIVADIENIDIVSCTILGTINELYVKVGEVVKKNQLVGILDMKVINEQVFKQEITVEKSKMNYDKQLGLYNIGKVDFYTLEFARLSLEAYENYLSDLYEKQVDHYLYATSSGTITEIFRFEGDSAKGDVLGICPLSNFLVQYEIPATDNLAPTDALLMSLDSGKLNNDGKIKILYDGNKYNGYVFRTSSQYSLAYDYFGDVVYGQIAFIGLPEKLILGKTTTIRYIEEEAYDVMVIPISTVYPNDDGTFYTYVVADNEIKFRTIEVGITDGIFYEVKSGLMEGDKVLKSR
ncbi:MAG: efflux RND transporter periplasmic adaptor subunit [Clostridiales bacterium]|nr:efflux RND transporter periplasmic adaptor subunit [Clostridiales bacterium]